MKWLILDLGNTFLKVALFSDQGIEKIWKIPSQEILKIKNWNNFEFIQTESILELARNARFGTGSKSPSSRSQGNGQRRRTVRTSELTVAGGRKVGEPVEPWAFRARPITRLVQTVLDPPTY